MCGLNRAWDDAAQKDAEDTAQTALRDARERGVLDCPGSGYRRVTKARQRAGGRVKHKPGVRIRRAESLLGHLKRRCVRTTTSAHGEQVYPQLLADALRRAPERA